jgi:hypothetical protein
MKQVLIAIDQFFNTLVYAQGEGFGMADETISARLWRLRNLNSRWGKMRKAVDKVALHCFRDADHCEKAFWHEYKKHQLPPSYSGDYNE